MKAAMLTQTARPRRNFIGVLFAGTLLAIICIAALVYMVMEDCTSGPAAASCVRILFIGNSYTFTNDLPGMFTRLARSGGHRLKTGIAAPGGWSFADHAKSADTLKALQSDAWEFVVLQEQSQLPSAKQERTTRMYPAARLLVGQIRAIKAAPIFFQTWAHRDGWPEMGMQDYAAMQAQIDIGYQQIAQELNVPIAPAGYAWLTARKQNPAISLWSDDGSHPNEQGTYLAACVFYATIFRQSPEGLSYVAHLSPETAHTLQAIAANVVLKKNKK
jgi:hypothetical protein